MQKNLVLALALSMMVYGLWLIWVAKQAPRQLPQEAVPAVSAPVPAISVTPGPSQARPLVQWPGHESLRFSAHGGALAGFSYRDVSGPVELFPADSPGFFSTWPELAFEPVGSDGSRFVLEARHPSGARIRKTYLWGEQKQLPHLRLEIMNPGATPVRIEGWSLSLGPGLETVESEKEENAGVLRALASFQEPPRRAPTVSKLKPGTHSRAWNWAGIDNRYFLAAAFIRLQDFPSASVMEVKQGDNEVPLLVLGAPAVDLSPGQSRTFDIPFYIGPKDYIALQDMGKGLETSVDFGFFGILGKLAFQALRALYEVVGNYGFAIILLTLLLQTILLPLTLKSMKASLAMQKLQPKIQEVQRKYKGDPSRMNVEMMALYKTSGTNPLGGCLPLLLQLPIFWAFFTTLRNCWELHGAPFILWIHDLSVYDPYYVLPVTVGILMFLQQRMNPQAGDPAQQKIFMFMPLIFTFMFLKFPSGLVLYWMFSSLYGLAQQTLYKRYSKA